MSNLYWPIYKNLERECLQLANYVHFSDDQTDVYSMHIADLIVRCAIEIEAISKDLYQSIGGNMNPTDASGNSRDLYFDTDCLDFLEQKWRLSTKKITVSATNFYFNDSKNKVLTPLYKAHKRGTSGSKWKQAYQAVKHDRKKSLSKANIENLIHALGALYILNLYYRDERIDIGRVYLGDHYFDDRVGSDVFSVHSCRATGLNMSDHLDDSCIFPSLESELDESIYIIKYDDNSIKEMHKNFCLDSAITRQRYSDSPEIKKYLAEHPEDQDKGINEVCMAAGGIALLQRIMSFQHTLQEKSARMEGILNKHSSIYPELFPPTTSSTL